VERVEGEDKFFFSFRLGFLLFVKRDGEKKKKTSYPLVCHLLSSCCLIVSFFTE
jgi:hypothetical protein